jgi:SPP1 gp7 family putative phage head morphogenesis protein
MAISKSHAAQIALMEAIERRFTRAMYRELRRAYLAGLDGWQETGAVPELPEHAKNVAEIVTRFAEIAVRRFGGTIGAKSRQIERKDFAQTMAKLAFRYISQEAVRQRITSITETTRGNIVNAVQRGFDEGLGQEGVGRYVRDLVPGLSRARANIIARTETHGAANYGAFGAAAETGLELRKEWLAAEDGRTRPDHADMHGTIIGMDDAFQFPGYSLQYPGDPSGPPEAVINCRCTLAFIPA